MIRKTQFETEQEVFWAGSFGIDYIQRNRGSARLASKLDCFARSLSHTWKLKLVGYGFVYRRDPRFPQGDITWFLMEKRYIGNRQNLVSGRLKQSSLQMPSRLYRFLGWGCGSILVGCELMTKLLSSFSCYRSKV